MPGGIFDSSKTRVRPVFDQLWQAGRDWLPDLLTLATAGCPGAKVNVAAGDFTLTEGYWEPNEKCLAPPVSLLAWLIRNLSVLESPPVDEPTRSRLAVGDPAEIEKALRLLRTEGASRAWYIFEGPTCPDVLLIAHDVVVVIEGKRTEPTATTKTKWLTGRHQMWRHLDAAWEIRGRRSVYGMFIVEGDESGDAATVPQQWKAAAEACLAPNALRSSFPHRSDDEIGAIAQCFLGVTTWRHVCDRFGLDWCGLPHDTSTLRP